MRLRAGGIEVDVELESFEAPFWRARVGEESVELSLKPLSDGALLVSGKGFHCRAFVRKTPGGIEVSLGPWRTVLREVVRSRSQTARAAAAVDIVAPMPGRILKVLAQAGDEVGAGDPVVVLEAMKMETVLRAEFGGRIVRLHAAEGEMVEGGAVLVELEPIQSSVSSS